MAHSNISSLSPDKEPHKGYIAEPSTNDLEQIEARRRALDGQPIVSTRTRSGGIRKQVVFRNYGHDSGDSATQSANRLRVSLPMAPRNLKRKRIEQEIASKEEEQVQGATPSNVVEAYVQEQADTPEPFYDDLEGGESERPATNTKVPAATQPPQVPQPPTIAQGSGPTLSSKNHDNGALPTAIFSTTDRLRTMMLTAFPKALALARADHRADPFGPDAEVIADDGKYTMWSILVPSEYLTNLHTHLLDLPPSNPGNDLPDHQLEHIMNIDWVSRLEVKLIAHISLAEASGEQGDHERFEEFRITAGGQESEAVELLKGVRCQDGHMMWAMLTDNDWLEELRRQAARRELLWLRAVFAAGRKQSVRFWYRTI